MHEILACLTEQHDPWAVLAAAGLCLLSALSCALVLRGEGWVRPALAAVTIGAGAWSTHFVALLAFDPGLPAGFALAPTLLSVLAVILTSLLAFAIWSRGAATAWRRSVAGAVLGLGIGGMHSLGMGAVRLPGHMTFLPEHVVASLLLAALIGALSLRVLRPDATRARRFGGAALLVATIVSLHFTGMGGVEVWPDPTVGVPPAALPRLTLAGVVTGVTAALMAILSILALEARLGLATRAAEAERLRNLADAAFEALALLDAEGRVVDASSRLAELSGTTREALIGRPFAALLAEEAEGGTATLSNGVPVELRRRAIETAAGPRTVVPSAPPSARRSRATSSVVPSRSGPMTCSSAAVPWRRWRRAGPRGAVQPALARESPTRAAVASRSTRSFIGSPEWPRTQRQSTSCGFAAASRRCHSS